MKIKKTSNKWDNGMIGENDPPKSKPPKIPKNNKNK